VKASSRTQLNSTMADLDDFFAKKDRKKNKGKKFSTADEIAKKLEETGKKAEKPKEKKPIHSQIGGQDVDEQGNKIQDEDEWKDFEEEKKDYTGLKIQNLTIADESGEDGEDGGEDDEGGMEENEAGEMVPKKKQTGPWRVVTVEEPAPPPAPVAAPPPPTTPSVYIPPVRKQVLAEGGSSGLAGRLRARAAPDVKSEELFPTLSAAVSQEANSAWGKKKDGGPLPGFEEARNSKSHSARYEHPHANRHIPLGTSNRYGALDHDQS